MLEYIVNTLGLGSLGSAFAEILLVFLFVFFSILCAYCFVSFLGGLFK